MAIFKSLAQREIEARREGRKIKTKTRIEFKGGLTPTIGDGKFTELVDIEYIGRKLDRAAQRRAKITAHERAQMAEVPKQNA